MRVRKASLVLAELSPSSWASGTDQPSLSSAHHTPPTPSHTHCLEGAPVSLPPAPALLCPQPCLSSPWAFRL